MADDRMAAARACSARRSRTATPTSLREGVLVLAQAIMEAEVTEPHRRRPRANATPIAG